VHPFAVAGAGPRAIEVAARHGELWVTYGRAVGAEETSPEAAREAVRQQVGLLDAACSRAGRDSASIDRLYLQGLSSEPWLESLESFRDLAGTYAELGFTDVALHWPRTEAPFVSNPDVFEAILAEQAP
jgi:alkanesulfonate monooxygenase SsuD/methylene tetrahydromethanopterin reductase-like flavin-dependent oxidoreductase (luciferase family)